MSTNVLTAGNFRSAETDAGDAFADAILACLVLIALPIKNLAYLVPPIFVAMQLLSSNVRFVERTFLWGCLMVSLSSVSILIDSFNGQVVNAPGLLFGILTYAPLAVMLGLRSNFTVSPARWRALKNAVVWFVIIQSVIGLMQFAASGLSDAVCGTFGLLDFRGEVTIGQVYLTFNLFAMILFLLTDAAGTMPKVAIVAGLLACAVAHSGHQTLFLMASLAVVGVMQMRFVDVLKLGAVLAVIVGLTVTLSSIYLDDAENWYQKIVLDEDSPKRMITVSAGEIMLSPKNLLLGVGLGQFGSRAALISSGEYLTMQLPTALVGESGYYRTFIQPGNLEHLESGEGSAISKPYFSVLNLIVEGGVPLAIFLLMATAIEFFRNRKLSKSPDSHTRFVGILANVGLLFFVLCCFIENYVEFPQAIFLPMLLYVAARSRTKRP
jgi:hypothetical protein